MTTASSSLRDPRLYTKLYLESRKITVNERGELKDPQGKNNLQVFDTMYLDYLSQTQAYNAIERQKASNLRNIVQPVAEKVLIKALSELIANKKIDFRNEVIKSFKCESEDLTLLKAYVKAVTGNESLEDVAVMAHWMWQVKTKMNGKSPSYHTMPILFGKQEGGKTVAMNKLIAPINNFRLNISLDQMTDNRYYKSMAENYVIVFDEMQGADRADIDALKKQVTIDENDYRPMGTNEVYKVRQACSFIGATNRPVAEQIVDATGMRRFWQVNCLDKLDWEVLSSIDYVQMWKGIDENKEDGYILAQINEIRAIQAGMVAKEEIVLFMEARGIVAGKSPTKQVSSAELYADYKQWSIDNGFKPMNNAWFGRRLTGKGITNGITTSNRKSINYFNVPSEYSSCASNFYTDFSEVSKLLNIVKN